MRHIAKLDYEDGIHQKMSPTHGRNASEAFPEFNQPFDTPDGEEISDQSIEEVNRDSPHTQAVNRTFLEGELKSVWLIGHNLTDVLE